MNFRCDLNAAGHARPSGSTFSVARLQQNMVECESDAEIRTFKYAAHRGGFSLLEVLLAIGLLLSSLAILSQLTTIGRTHLDKATSKSIAVRLCQNKLARLLAGMDPIRHVDETPLEEDPNWEYRVEITPVPLGDLSELSVSVRPATLSSGSDASADAPPWFTLVRWIPAHLTAAGLPAKSLPTADRRQVTDHPSVAKP